MSSLERARTVADAVLYEGYLLYPYRATSSKNRVRWQFGVLGPPGAAAAGFGEEPDMQAQCLLGGGPEASVTLRLRFLQLQTREVQQASAPDAEDFTPVEEFRLGGQDVNRPLPAEALTLQERLGRGGVRGEGRAGEEEGEQPDRGAKAHSKHGERPFGGERRARFDRGPGIEAHCSSEPSRPSSRFAGGRA